MNGILSLFEVVYPEGFFYIPNFITAEEESKLLNDIENIQLQPMRFRGYEAKRKVFSFGNDWDFETLRLVKTSAIPPVFNSLIEKVAEFTKVSSSAFQELLVTQYPPGAIINWHRDAPPYDIIVGISLLSDGVFRLRPFEKERRVKRSGKSIVLERRSIYVMYGPARSEWQHSIEPVKEMRYSVTLRTMKDSASQ
ncbi:alpha-ketoglutarate-dependent dioxygenase AlkB [Filimonas zeae]|nr:alpha-ketoglutarate-dependent dioxygenase AlkB [Filimonas zeae]